MILTFLFLLGAMGTGSLCLSLIPITFYRWERYAATTVLGLFLATWLLLLSSWILGFTIGSLVSLVLLSLGTLWSLRVSSKTDMELKMKRQRSLWKYVTGGFSLVIAYLLWTHMLGPGFGGVYSSSGSWGDLPLHLSIISNVAHSSHFNWDFSLMVGAKLTYPFLVDFASGMIMRWTGSMRAGLLLISLPLSLAAIQILFFFFLRVLKSVRAAALGTTIFFLSGSSFGFGLAIYDFFHQRPFTLSFLWNLPHDYSNTWVFGFGNFINSILMPQRSFQFGLPLLCLVLILLYESYKAKKEDRNKILFGAGIITGLLPLGHTHTFFIALGLLGIAFLLECWQKRRLVTEWLWALLPALLLALPQLKFQLTANGHVGFITKHAGWMFSDNTFHGMARPLAILLYILANFGLIFAFALLGYRRIRDSFLRILFALAIVIFIGGNMFIFQPAQYDNIKFFFYGFLFLIPPIALYLSKLSRSKKPWVFGILMTALVASGALATIRELRQNDLLYTTHAFEQADSLRAVLPPDALVLTSDFHEHPLWALAGQPVVRGYSYWLWSYGLPVQPLDAAVPAMYRGGNDAVTLFKKYNVKYVFIGPWERTLYHVNESFFADNYTSIYDEDDMVVYQVVTR